MAIITTAVGTTPTSIITASEPSAITFASLCNYSAQTVLMDVFIVPSGDAAGNSTIFLKQLELTANDSYELYHAAEKIIIDNGDSVMVSASIDSTITAIVSYVGV